MTTGKISPLHREDAVLCALAFMFLPLAVVATLQLWILAAAGALAILAMRALRGDFPANQAGVLPLLLTAIAAWSALSMVWAIDPDRTLYTAGRLALVAIALVILVRSAVSLDANERRRFDAFLVAGGVLGLVLTAFLISASSIVPALLGLSDDQATDHQLNILNRTAAVVAMVTWPIALAAARRYGRSAAVAAVLLSVATLFILNPLAPRVALATGGMAFAAAWLSPRWGKRALLITFATSIAIIPFLGQIVPVLKDSLILSMTSYSSEAHRFGIWQFASERILERPLLGWGLGSARAIHGGAEQIVLLRPDGSNPTTGQAMPLHPHNALVQIWLELGIVGLVLTGCLFAYVVTLIPESEDSRAGAATMIATVACAFVIAQLSFGIWQGWWMAALGQTAVIVTAGTGSGAMPDRTRAPSDQGQAAS